LTEELITTSDHEPPPQRYFRKNEPREEWNWIEVVGAPFSPARLSLTASSSSLCEERENQAKVAVRNSAKE
jgi:hypothetical protein